jgi:hypothetical protein
MTVASAAAESPASPARRAPHGRFAPGVSGNPAGRPRGARNRASLLEEALHDGEAETLARRLVELALAGDKSALRFCVARLLPRPKGRAIELDLPAGAEADRAAILDAALRAVVSGEVTPDEALSIARLVELRDRAARPATQRSAAAKPAARPARPDFDAVLGALGTDRPAAACKSPVFPATRSGRRELLASASRHALAA